MLRQCETFGVLLLSVAWLAFSVSAKADDTASLLQGVHWAGPAVTLEGLRGKTVVVLDYATWCPKCNAWSGEFCKQLKAAIDGKPVVILAIGTDEDPSGVKQYLTQRGFFAPNIIHGYDPKIIKRAGLPELWGYMIIDRAGKVVKKGQAGTYYEEAGAKKFVLAREIEQGTHLGEFLIIEPNMADAVKQLLWPMELGINSGGISSQGRRSLSADQKEQIDAAIAKYLDKELEKVRKLAEGETREQFEAYELATTFSTRYKTSEQGKEARKVLVTLEGDAKFKRELAAKKAYDKCGKTSSSSSRRASALKALAKRFEGTHYGEQAKKASEEKGG